jgi:hypothetical protein
VLTAFVSGVGPKIKSETSPSWLDFDSRGLVVLFADQSGDPQLRRYEDLIREIAGREPEIPPALEEHVSDSNRWSSAPAGRSWRQSGHGDMYKS